MMDNIGLSFLAIAQQLSLFIFAYIISIASSKFIAYMMQNFDERKVKSEK